MRKHIIIEEIDGELVVQVLQTGYNIIEKTIYDTELAQSILNQIDKAVE